MKNEKLWELVLEWKINKGTFKLNSDNLLVLKDYHLSERDFYNILQTSKNIPVPGDGIWG